MTELPLFFQVSRGASDEDYCKAVHEIEDIIMMLTGVTAFSPAYYARERLVAFIKGKEKEPEGIIE